MKLNIMELGVLAHYALMIGRHPDARTHDIKRATKALKIKGLLHIGPPIPTVSEPIITEKGKKFIASILTYGTGWTPAQIEALETLYECEGQVCEICTRVYKVPLGVVRTRCLECSVGSSPKKNKTKGLTIELHPRNKYSREIKPGVYVDVYDVLQAFGVTCPAMAHGIKKMLAPGQRGAKDSIQDKREAIASIERSIEMEGATDN